MAGFIDLSALALVVGYQMHFRGMTPMGVLVLPVGYLKLDPRINSPGTVAKNCKKIF